MVIGTHPMNDIVTKKRKKEVIALTDFVACSRSSCPFDEKPFDFCRPRVHGISVLVVIVRFRFNRAPISNEAICRRSCPELSEQFFV
jgi:hypothetical protein